MRVFIGYSRYLQTYYTDTCIPDSLGTTSSVYTCAYAVPLTGIYSLVLALAEPGLNATYFTSVNGASSVHTAMQQGVIYEPSATNVYNIRIDYAIDFNFTADFLSYNTYNTHNMSASGGAHMSGVVGQKPPQDNWSARWYGLITPVYAERYEVIILTDSSSTVKVYIGDNVMPIIDCNTDSCRGSYTFTSTAPVLIVMEYAHGTGLSFLSLQWSSVSTPLSVIPASAFSHYSTISAYNLTVTPAVLSPSSSTYNAPSDVIAGTPFYTNIFARDVYGNLLSNGGDTPYILAVGPYGTHVFSTSANTMDNNNGTYTIAITLNLSGVHRIYVTLGCCPPASDLSVSAQLDSMQSRLLGEIPVDVTVASTYISGPHSTAQGNGVGGGYVGHILSFAVHLKDVYGNTDVFPSTLSVHTSVQVVFINSIGDIVTPAFLDIQLSDQSTALITYNLTRIGGCMCHVTFNLGAFGGSSSLPVLELNMLLERPSASHCLTNILLSTGQNGVPVGSNLTFTVTTRDAFLNPYPVSNLTLYIRILGEPTTTAVTTGATGDIYSILNTPTCTDLTSSSNLVTCTTLVTYSGPHQIVTRLLNTSYPLYSGNGLSGYYFTSLPHPQGALQDTAYYTQIDPTITLTASSSSEGSICTPVGADGRVPYLCACHSAVWTGYLLIPRTGPYRFRIQGDDSVTSEVYIEDGQNYDSSNTNRDDVVNLIQGVSYTIKVYIQSYNTLLHTSATLQWVYGNARVREWVSIPQTYMYNTAEDVYTSPMVVNIY